MNPTPESAAARFPSRGLFVTATDTEVGKTFVTAMIARRLLDDGLRVGVYKPVASGCGAQDADDGQQIWEAAGKPATLARVCPQTFAAPLAPHLAAKLEDRQVDEELLLEGLTAWKDQCDIVLVEGVGGLMSPVSEELYCADLADAFGYKLLVVVPNRLGCINQALQTLITATAFRDGLEIAGVVLNDVDPASNDPSAASNLDELLARCQPPILAHLGHAQAHAPPVDWLALTGRAATD